jgi:hypothetical protein
MYPSRHIDRSVSMYIHRDITIARNRSLSWASRFQFKPPASFPKIHSDPILHSMPWSSEWSFSFGLPHQNFVQFFPLFHACQMPWEWVQIMKQFPPFPRHIFPFRTLSNKILILNGLKFDFTVPQCPVRRWTLFFLHCFLFLYFHSNFHNKRNILRKLTRPCVHYRVNTLRVSICSCCWYELYAGVLRHIFQ